jgi:predicted dehydrogenase
MEKPIAKDVHDAAALVEEHETQFAAQRLILAVAEQFRYDPGHERARQVIADGAIGDLTAVHGRIWQNVQPGNKFYESEWRKKPAYQGGFLLDGGVHFVSLIRYVSGLEIQETASFSKQTFDHLPPVDTVHGALRFSSGALGTLSMTFASAKNEYRYDFIGTKGSVTLTGEDGGTRIVVENAKGQVVSDENVKGNATIEELSAFFAAIGSGNGKVDDRGSPRQALADVAVVESLLTGGGLVRM